MITVTEASSSTEILLQVTSSSDDAEENISGRVSLTSSDLEMVFEKTENQTVGIRFNGVNIPPAASILNATIQFTVDEATNVPTTLLIEGDASDHAAIFDNTLFNISSRARTGAGVSWAPAAWTVAGAAGAEQLTPNLASIVQEIVSRPGWNAGNSIAFIITGEGERVAESFNGDSAAAARLHVEFTGDPVNLAPVVDAGAGGSLLLPANTFDLDGTVTDDGLPGGPLTTSWSHVGGTGSGVVSFDDPGSVDTRVTFSGVDIEGTYILNLNADDGERSADDQVTVNIIVGGYDVVGLNQVNFFSTGFDALSGNPLTIPSIDPAGVTFHPPTGRLFISDSEINEVPAAFDIVQASLFESEASGDTLFNQWDLTQQTGNEPYSNREPTGIGFCSGDQHFYVTNDDLKLVYRYAFDGAVFSAVDSVSTQPYSADPEGIACDPINGRIYVIGGAGINILVYEYASGFVLQEVIDLVTAAGDPVGVPSDPEGIAVDPVTGHLFVVSDPDNAIFEYAPSGAYIQKFAIDALSPKPMSPQGLGIGDSSVNPEAMSIYMVDGMLDNDYDPNERDGSVYELEIQRAQ